MIRWLRDWRTIASLAGAVLVGLLAVLVITSISDREAALQVAKRTTANEQAERVALNRRIDQLEADAQGNSAQLAALRREVALLQQQVRDLGGQPVGATSSDGTSSQPSPKPTRSPSPRPTPIRTPTPSPTPSRTCVIVVCVHAHNKHGGDGGRG